MDSYSTGVPCDGTMQSSASRVFRIAELCTEIFNKLRSPSDLVKCICFSYVSYDIIIRMLYKGAVTNLRFRSPDTAALDFLLGSSRDRFAQNLEHTEHLLIFPRRTGQEQSETSKSSRLVGLDPFQALQSRPNAELLFRPHGRQLKSLASPLELPPFDLLGIQDLIFSSSLQSLSIDNAYCELILSSHKASQVPATSPLPNLSALTVYVSRQEYKLISLYNLIGLLDLKVFNLQRVQPIPRDFQVQIKAFEKLLEKLSQQDNLQAIGLNNCEMTWYAYNGYEETEQSRGKRLWPQLKALYVIGISRQLCRMLPDWENLRILNVDLFFEAREMPFERLAQLAVVDLITDRQESRELPYRIASSCPKLRHLRVALTSREQLVVMTRNDFVEVTKSLPDLEVLSLDYGLSLHGPDLLELSETCPNLRILELQHTWVELTYTSLVRRRPLENLQVLKLYDLAIYEADKFQQGEPLQNFAKTWRQKFPSLRHTAFGSHANMNWDSQTIEPAAPLTLTKPETMDWALGELVVETPNTRRYSHRYGVPDPEQYDLYQKLSTLLGYNHNVSLMEHIRLKWLNDYEVSLFEWPIIPFALYMDPKNVPEDLEGPMAPAAVLKQRNEQERGIMPLRLRSNK